jgi:uncharacterized protein DUF4012
VRVTDPADVETGRSTERAAPREGFYQGRRWSDPLIARRRRRRLLIVTLLVVAAVALAAAVATVRYRPLVEDAFALRQELRGIASSVRDVGPRLDGTSLAGIRAEADAVKARHARLAAALAGDPLVGLARLLPELDRQVRAADDLVQAAGLLLGVMDDGIGVGTRFVQIRDQPPGASKIEAVVRLAVDSRDELAAATTRVNTAFGLLDAIPDDALGPIRAARDEARDQLTRYRRVLAEAVQATSLIPSFLGWDRPRRYLVLAQDPAELRPTGGYIGQYGIITFDQGRIVEMTFRDISTIYNHPAPPFVHAPAPLRNHLLGPFQSWRLADANWSPDFPTAARQAAAFYRSEPKAQPIDGVIGLTTYAIDDLLDLTGSIDVPGFDVKIDPGNATFGILAATRGPRVPGGDRKAILGVFARRLLDALYALPSSRWTDVPTAFERIRAEHHAALWMTEPNLQTEVSKAGWDGSLPVARGDELIVVEANVGPVSKLNLVTDRHIDLTMTLDEAGNAHGQLSLQYNNHIRDASADEATRKMASVLRAAERRDHLGIYVRLLVPVAAQIAETTLTGGKPPVGGLEAVDEELGRRSFGAYAMVPPGQARLDVSWVTPGVVERVRDGRWRYRLSLPKPPGRLADPLRVTIQLPPGMRAVNVADPTLTQRDEDGAVALVREAPFRWDLSIDIEFERAPPAG